jgi:hypothetical protein
MEALDVGAAQIDATLTAAAAADRFLLEDTAVLAARGGFSARAPVTLTRGPGSEV